MKWIRQVFEKEIQPEEVFALEICPYHSKKWETIQRLDQQTELINFISEHVIAPAVVAATENELDFVVAIGKSIVDLLEVLMKGQHDVFADCIRNNN